ncbi:major capsid protein [Achromobacter anxifer]
MTMNSRQARVVDPILSTHALGYRQAGLIGRRLFPIAPVGTYGGQVIEFGKESFRLLNTKRAPGAATRRVDFGYAGKPYVIVPSGLEAKVPRELMRDASQVPGIDLATRAVNLVLRVTSLSHEAECAQIALNAANYDNDHKVKLAGADRWTSPDSDPTGDVEVAKEAIANSIGLEPNRLMISRKALAAARAHPKIIERFKYTSAQAITIQMLQQLWDIEEIVVGNARAVTGANDAFTDVWRTAVWLGYVSGNEIANAEEPSFGYTYRIEGHPAVEAPYWDDNAKSWIYGVSDDNAPVLSGMAAGYLIEDAGAK